MGVDTGYNPRHPEDSILYEVVAEQLQTFLAGILKPVPDNEHGPGGAKQLRVSGLTPSLTRFGFLCFYAFMRTTVELPPEIMKKAKAQAAARGESLKTLLTRAVASELGRATDSGRPASRVRLPLFGDDKKAPVKVSGRDIALALSADDVKLSIRSGRPRKR